MVRLNKKQLELFTKYLSTAILNNQEIHPSDMPPVVSMFKLLADRDLSVSDEQIDTICESLHSLANREVPTSDFLRDFLKNVAAGFRFYVEHPDLIERFKRPSSLIADDILSGNDIEYSETS